MSGGSCLAPLARLGDGQGHRRAPGSPPNRAYRIDSDIRTVATRRAKPRSSGKSGENHAGGLPGGRKCFMFARGSGGDFFFNTMLYRAIVFPLALVFFALGAGDDSGLGRRRARPAVVPGDRGPHPRFGRSGGLGAASPGARPGRRRALRRYLPPPGRGPLERGRPPDHRARGPPPHGSRPRPALPAPDQVPVALQGTQGVDGALRRPPGRQAHLQTGPAPQTEKLARPGPADRRPPGRRRRRAPGRNGPAQWSDRQAAPPGGPAHQTDPLVPEKGLDQGGQANAAHVRGQGALESVRIRPRPGPPRRRLFLRRPRRVGAAMGERRGGAVGPGCARGPLDGRPRGLAAETLRRGAACLRQGRGDARHLCVVDIGLGLLGGRAPISSTATPRTSTACWASRPAIRTPSTACWRVACWAFR